MTSVDLADKGKFSYDAMLSGNSKVVIDEELRAPILTEAERNRLLRKIDIHILPFVSLLYLLSFLHVTFHLHIVSSYWLVFQGSVEYRLVYFALRLLWVTYKGQFNWQGNARIAGMAVNAHLTGLRYNVVCQSGQLLNLPALTSLHRSLQFFLSVFHSSYSYSADYNLFFYD